MKALKRLLEWLAGILLALALVFFLDLIVLISPHINDGLPLPTWAMVKRAYPFCVLLTLGVCLAGYIWTLLFGNPLEKEEGQELHHDEE